MCTETSDKLNFSRDSDGLAGIIHSVMSWKNYLVVVVVVLVVLVLVLVLLVLVLLVLVLLVLVLLLLVVYTSKTRGIPRTEHPRYSAKSFVLLK